MDRWNRSLLTVAAIACLGLSLLSTGCNVISTGLYVLTGTDTEAEFKELPGKKVAIVCRPTTSLDFNNSSVSTMLAQQIGARLQQNIKKIEIVDQRRVGDWTDENTWEDYVEIGKALNADLVIGVDLEEFNLYQGQTLYQGRADVHFAVYDVTKDKIHVWEKFLPPVVYPPTAPIPASELPEGAFRRKFVGALADQISKYFYPHDSTADFAADSTVLY